MPFSARSMFNNSQQPLRIVCCCLRAACCPTPSATSMPLAVRTIQGPALDPHGSLGRRALFTSTGWAVSTLSLPCLLRPRPQHAPKAAFVPVLALCPCQPRAIITDGPAGLGLWEAISNAGTRAVASVILTQLPRASGGGGLLISRWACPPRNYPNLGANLVPAREVVGQL